MSISGFIVGLSFARIEHAFGVGGGCRGNDCGCRALQLRYLGADVLHVGRFVALAAMGRRGQVGRVGFQHQIGEIHFPHGVGQPAFFERDDSADAEKEIAAGFEPFVGRGIFAERVEHAPQAAAAELLDNGDHFGPGVACMHGDGQMLFDGQKALAAKGLGLLVAEVGRPVEIQSDFAHGAKMRDALGRILEESFDEVQLLAPMRIVVDRRGVQPHHREASVGWKLAIRTMLMML